jgi:hypothetical protein
LLSWLVDLYIAMLAALDRAFGGGWHDNVRDRLRSFLRTADSSGSGAAE